MNNYKYFADSEKEVEYEVIDEYTNNGYTITVRKPILTEVEQLERDSIVLRKLKYALVNNSESEVA